MEKPAPVSPPSGTVVVVAERPAARWSIRWALDDAVKFVWSNLAVPCLLQPFRDQLQKLAGGFLRRHARRLRGVADPYLTVTVAEHDGGEGTMRPRNDAYGGQGRARDDAGRRRFVLSLGDSEEVVDEFRGATVWWFHSAAPRRDYHHHGDVVAVEDDAAAATAGRTYRLTFHQRHRDLVVDSYLPHVCREGRAILSATRRRKLFTNTGERYAKSSWSHVVFKHPSTFETLAMDPRKKKEIMDDLDAFRNGEDYYKRIGKAWKRGYLLYGPPGTGKSSMIAAMANYLDYHIYDIELTSVSTNTDLRKMFIDTKGKSIIVIEDIDCSLDLTGKRGGSKKKQLPFPVTLSGVLNFIDGLWSACGGERIIVFTTNHVDKLDPALVQSGRMDKHIEMSYCCFEAFKFLAKNYLDVDAHHLFDAVAALLKEVDITPADVAELLTPKQRAAADEHADSCLAALVEALQKAKEEDAAQAKAKKAGGKKGKKVEVADGNGAGDVRVLLREDDVAELLTSKCAVDDEGSCLDGPVEVLREAEETAMAAAKNASSDKEDEGVVEDY
nr:unnamed protein product [Digitaria exilis]